MSNYPLELSAVTFVENFTDSDADEIRERQAFLGGLSLLEKLRHRIIGESLAPLGYESEQYGVGAPALSASAQNELLRLYDLGPARMAAEFAVRAAQQAAQAENQLIAYHGIQSSLAIRARGDFDAGSFTFPVSGFPRRQHAHDALIKEQGGELPQEPVLAVGLGVDVLKSYRTDPRKLGLRVGSLTLVSCFGDEVEPEHTPIFLDALEGTSAEHLLFLGAVAYDYAQGIENQRHRL